MKKFSGNASTFELFLVEDKFIGTRSMSDITIGAETGDAVGKPTRMRHSAGAAE